MPYFLWPFALILGILLAGFFLSCSLDEKGTPDYGQKSVVLNHLIHYFLMGLLAVFIFGPPAGFVYLFYDQNSNYLLSLALGIICGLIVQAILVVIWLAISNR